MDNDQDIVSTEAKPPDIIRKILRPYMVGAVLLIGTTGLYQGCGVIIRIKQMQHAVHLKEWLVFKSMHSCKMLPATQVAPKTFKHLAKGGYKGGVVIGDHVLTVEEGILWKCTYKDAVIYRADKFIESMR